MIVGQVLTAASVAILCGIVIAAAVGTGLSSLLFGVKPLDAAVLASVAALIVLVALAASAFPVWRASRVDPVVALRGE
jgi:ABC-type antimicrobial peptide transport system permease subunit